MKFIAFDTETTGFLPGIDNVVELCAIRFDDGVPVGKFSTLINPLRSMPAESSRINGITDEMLKGQPTIDAVLGPFAEFCGSDLMVAHNAPFDVQFLAYDIKKHETAAPSGIILDTCAMAKKVFPGLMNYKLGTLVQHLNFDAGGYHRAEADSNYCGQLFWQMLEKISQNGTVPALENLIALSNNNALRLPKVEKKPKQLDLLASLGL